MKHILEEALEEQIAELGNAMPGTEEYERISKSCADLAKAINEADKNEVELRKIDVEEIKDLNENKRSKIKAACEIGAAIVVAVGGIAKALIGYRSNKYSVNRVTEYEEEHVVTSKAKQYTNRIE